MRFLLFALVLVASSLSFGFANNQPVRDVNKLIDPKPEAVLKVKTARVILADYPLIRHDFPTTRFLSDADIDQWLLRKAGYVSKAQASQRRVNTQIQIENAIGGKAAASVTAFRPQLYGRALVFKADDGLIDVKGAGSEIAPTFASHKSGLASLGEMIREFLYQKKVQQVLEHSGAGLNTLESYAVIDWGFSLNEVRDGSFAEIPAGAILRRGNARQRLFKTGNHFASTTDSFLIENLLRRYGITSTGDADAEDKFDRVNIQVTQANELVDFGAFLVKDHFTKDMHMYGGGFLASLSESAQPDTRMELPVNIWGSTVTGRANPRFDNPWVWSHELAMNLKTGKASIQDVRTHFDNFMAAGYLPPEFHGIFTGVLSKQTICVDAFR